MLQAIRKRMEDDKGFTLIELMVVVLIIAILIAIAIPTFLGLRQRAQDRAAQSDLRNGLTAAKAWFTDDDQYTGFDAAEGATIEPSLTWNDAGAAVLNEVSVRGVTVDEVVMATESASGAVFCIGDRARDNVNGSAGTFRGTQDAATVAACSGGW